MAKEAGPPLFILHTAEDGVYGECGFCPFSTKGYDEERASAALLFVQLHLVSAHHIEFKIKDTPEQPGIGEIELCKKRTYIQRGQVLTIPIPITLTRKPDSLVVSIS